MASETHLIHLHSLVFPGGFYIQQVKCEEIKVTYCINEKSSILYKYRLTTLVVIDSEGGYNKKTEFFFGR